ncbi:hypothetical protein [Paraburkholderia sp. EG304]|uniref:hypothetical protein n=1 Tax=Paraburkholderia sp. EG304 TaxID=3237015 RepID=UPI00397A08C8
MTGAACRARNSSRQLALDRFAQVSVGHAPLTLRSTGTGNLLEQFAHSGKYSEAVARELFQTRFVRPRRVPFFELTVLIALVAPGVVTISDGLLDVRRFDFT